jgi:hypothetical protein
MASVEVAAQAPAVAISPGIVVGSGAFTYRVELLRKPFGLRDLREAVERAVRRPNG